MPGPVRGVNEFAFQAPGEPRFVEALRPANAVTLSFVAEAGAEIVDNILFSPVVIDAADRFVGAVGLGPMAVHPSCKRRGIASALVTTALRMLTDVGHPIVVVLGHPDFYPRFGFARASRWGVRWEHTCPDEAFMALALIPGALEDCNGVVRYHPEFAAV